PTRAAPTPEENRRNRATLRVVPALAVRRADTRRLHRHNTHNTAHRAAPCCAQCRNPKVPPHLVFLQWNSAQ
ncbi:hypothetical protein A2U01_0103133, partial [Trifolium medium]|nr:hypothetical protein [Trifolium medium]